jgi:hypothetical protein
MTPPFGRHDLSLVIATSLSITAFFVSMIRSLPPVFIARFVDEHRVRKRRANEGRTRVVR